MPSPRAHIPHAAMMKSRTRVYQLAGALCVAGAGAAMILPLAKVFGPPPASTAVRITPVVAPVEVLAPGFDTSAVAATLTKVTGYLAKSAEPKPDEHALAVKPEPVAPPPPPPTDWTYLGSVMGLERPSALVRIDGQQHMLRTGGVHHEHTLTQIDPKFITVRSPEGQERRIDLLARTQEFPTEPAKRPAMVRASVPIQPGMPAGVMAPPAIAGAPKPGGPENFDAMRKSARAAAVPPPRIDPAKLVNDPLTLFEGSGLKLTGQTETDQRLLKQAGDVLRKATDASVDLNQRLEIFRIGGIPPGTDPETAAARLRALGLSDTNQGLAEAIKANAGAGGGK